MDVGGGEKGKGWGAGVSYEGGPGEDGGSQRRADVGGEWDRRNCYRFRKEIWKLWLNVPYTSKLLINLSYEFVLVHQKRSSGWGGLRKLVLG